MNYFITGANRGIGLSLARLYQSRGQMVYACCRDRAAAAELVETGARVLQLDVADPSSIEQLGEKLGDASIDVLINNAGISGGGKTLKECNAAELGRIFVTNSVGPVLVAKALLEHLLRGERKLIVNISSQLGSITNNAGGSSYGYRASKAALNMLTRSMANELRPAGVTCVTMHPGWVRTQMGGEQAPLLPEAAAAMIAEQIAGFDLSHSGQFRSFDGSQLPW